MNWQDRWIVPLSAIAIAQFLVWIYILDPIAAPGAGTFTPLPVATPFAVFVSPKLRDPFMLANEWDSVLVNRDRLLRGREQAAAEAREEEEYRRLEREDAEYFRRHGRHLAKWKPRAKLALPTTSAGGTARRAAVPAPPPPPAFTVGGVMTGGGTVTAVVNGRVVGEGDSVQGFKVTKLDAKTVELEGGIDPWKGKRLSVEVNPQPKGLSFVKGPSIQGPPRRGVLVIPPMVGDQR